MFLFLMHFNLLNILEKEKINKLTFNYIFILFLKVLFLKIKKIIKKTTNKIEETSSLINKKLKYPIINKLILNKDIKRFVKKMDLLFSNNLWCK